MKRYALLGLALWMALLADLYFTDFSAFVLSLVVTPSIGLLLYATTRSRNIVLSIFMGFAFVSQALGPPFFFLAKESYVPDAGFGAIGQFGFGLGEFLQIYSYVVILLSGILGFSLLLTSLILRGQPPRHPALGSHRINRARTGARHSSSAYAMAVIAFVFALGIPINAFMYANHMGITGILPDPHPYHVTGILYNARMFLFPVLLFWLYSKSRRSWLLVGALLVYAGVSAFAAASRYQLLISVVALFYFAVLDRKTLLLIVLSVSTMILFSLVSTSRDLLYIGVDLPLFDLIRQGVIAYPLADISFMDIVGGIANRLWGPQDIVLAHQYSISDRLQGTIEYFRVKPVVPDLTYELYGMVFPEGSGYGVGIGLLAWMILLANKSILFLLLLAFVISLLLVIGESLVRAYVRLPAPFDTLAYPLAFFLVGSLFSSSLNWYYQLIIMAVLPLIGFRILRPAHLSFAESSH